MAFLFNQYSVYCQWVFKYCTIIPNQPATRVPLSINQPTFNLYSAGWQPKVGQPRRGTVGEGACDLMTEEFGGSNPCPNCLQAEMSLKIPLTPWLLPMGLSYAPCITAATHRYIWMWMVQWDINVRPFDGRYISAVHGKCCEQSGESCWAQGHYGMSGPQDILQGECPEDQKSFWFLLKHFL